MSEVIIDGSMGEGGGQVVRTSLALSMITGEPVIIEGVRAGRSKPGLLRQHLTALQAAAEICGARTEGAELRSERVVFEPGEVTPGAYDFAVGTAGSAGLVLQTILPALMLAEEPSTVTLEGGTHNPWAPSFDYLARAFSPQLERIGPRLELELERHGFYPAGGGRFVAQITPCPREELGQLELTERGEDRGRRAVAVLANLPEHVAQRELDEVHELMRWPREDLEVRQVGSPGPGNALWLEFEFEHVRELFTAFGARGKPAEQVAREGAEAAREYLASGAPVGEYLADQLLLPMALAGAGRVVCTAPSRHTLTQAELIEKFIPIEFVIERGEGKRWEITVEA